MLKKFTKEKLNEILEIGIEEFGEKGLKGASVNVIAKKADISIGALYKYYSDKDDFFLACFRRALGELDRVLTLELASEDKLLVHAEKIIRTAQQYSRDHRSYIKMYNWITSSTEEKYTKLLAKEIEGISAKIYTSVIERAMERGEIRKDIDPKLFAFFFDNMMMMMQFTYCCDYYKERFKVYCGEDIEEDDDRVVTELLKFFESAFTFEEKDVIHSR